MVSFNFLFFFSYAVSFITFNNLPQHGRIKKNTCNNINDNDDDNNNNN